jgi:hypothetical protein
MVKNKTKIAVGFRQIGRQSDGLPKVFFGSVEITGRHVSIALKKMGFCVDAPSFLHVVSVLNTSGVTLQLR